MIAWTDPVVLLAGLGVALRSVSNLHTGDEVTYPITFTHSPTCVSVDFSVESSKLTSTDASHGTGKAVG